MTRPMSASSDYDETRRRHAEAAIAKGHADAENLRELLICTTSKTTFAMVDAYFRKHHHDRDLLRHLVAIAMEGEDAGDAPWAAANTLADFPASMLVEHRAELLQLSRHPWTYLSDPAKKALSKLGDQARR